MDDHKVTTLPRECPNCGDTSKGEPTERACACAPDEILNALHLRKSVIDLERAAEELRLVYNQFQWNNRERQRKANALECVCPLNLTSRR
jgi:hypothetical protein